jgi:hypothetical protein
MVFFTEELHFLQVKKMGGWLLAEFSMVARVTEQRRLRELHPSGSLASPTSVTRKRTR